jgi:hypothetical protein
MNGYEWCICGYMMLHGVLSNKHHWGHLGAPGALCQPLASGSEFVNSRHGHIPMTFHCTVLRCRNGLESWVCRDCPLIIYIYIIYIIRDTMINLISHWIEWGARVWIRAKNGKHMQRLKIHEKPGFCTGNWDARRSILFLSGRTSSVFSPSSILKPRLYPPYRTKRLNPTTNGFMPKMGRVWVKNWMINDRYGH